MDDTLLKQPISAIYASHPCLRDFFLSCALTPPPTDCIKTLEQWFAELEYFTLDEVGFDREELPEQLFLFFDRMAERRSADTRDVETVTILGGHDKDGASESVELTLRRGDIVSIVGPTGSGKSRLLNDIEWLAQGDTPTGRRILINGKKPSEVWRFSVEKKLVAQLSQNMNFVMDISVGKFLAIHCESRMIDNQEAVIRRILNAANRLAGEPLLPDMPVTALSGGQSRALMIADTACISASPIILIDEIENAGIDRKQAVRLLVQAGKIVLMATHDPILALQADRRIVIRNGRISAILETTQEEKDVLLHLEAMNERLLACRERLRAGLTVPSSVLYADPSPDL